ncbi:type I 3-dehydroquinate dehydratase [Floccifex sp.]|uniref:type I 3-dehydroquinate dehydratase n=1 Tax=Floccifex sp. TaxID=2815810 RepID=UPI003F104871
MKTIEVRNIVFGQGKPKICIPVMGKTIDDLKKEIEDLKGLSFDVIEWRMDHFIDILNVEKALEAIYLIRNLLKDIVLLATFRTLKEGGEMDISNEDYVSLNKVIIDSKQIDFVDVECFTGEKEVKEIIDYAHENGVYVIMSNHDFDKTPSYDEIIYRLRKMQEYNADIPKIALMPQNKEDVLTLLKATKDMSEKYADRPIITMSMSGMGVISRLAGEVFGSCLTFGAAKKASAPGQINVNELNEVLDILHRSI